MSEEKRTKHQHLRMIEIEDGNFYEELIQVLRKFMGDFLDISAIAVVVLARTRDGLPPVTDPADRKILQWVTEDPDLTDLHIGQRLGISRQAANTRRCRLRAMGYRVR